MPTTPLELGSIDIYSTQSAITVGNAVSETYAIAYGPDAGNNVSGTTDQTVTSAPVYDPTTGATNTYTSTADLSGTNLNFTAMRTTDPTDKSLPVTVTYGGGNLNPEAPDLSVGAATTSAADFVVSGDADGVGPDNSSGQLVISSVITSAGSYDETIPIAVSYDGGSNTIDLTAQQDVYAPAVAAFAYKAEAIPADDPVVNLGTFHVGDAETAALQVTNVATGALTDTLSSASGSTYGVFTTLNGVSNLAAGNSGTIDVAVDTSQAGAYSAYPSLFGLVSHDPELDDIDAAGGVTLEATVNNLAQPAFALDSSGLYTLSRSGDNWTLNFGIATSRAIRPRRLPVSRWRTMRRSPTATGWTGLFPTPAPTSAASSPRRPSPISSPGMPLRLPPSARTSPSSVPRSRRSSCTRKAGMGPATRSCRIKR